MRQTAAVIETCVVATRIEGKGIGVDLQLLGHIGYHGGRRAFLDPKDPARIAHEAELDRIAELVVRSTSDLSLESILRRQSVVPDQACFVVWNAEQRLTLLRAQELSTCHYSSPTLFACRSHDLKQRCGMILLGTAAARTVHT